MPVLVRAICYFLIIALWSCHAKQGQFYHIRRGETVTRIAHNFDTSVTEIQKANPQLNIDRVLEGQRIWVPSTRKPSQANAQVQRVIEQSKPKSTTRTTKKPTRASPTPQVKNDLNFKWPYRGRVLNGFGKQNLKMHNGIDIQIPNDARIQSSQAGTVAYVGEGIEGYGKTIILKHPDYLFSIYSYVGDILVAQGQQVPQGQSIAKARREGDRSFFHFEIRKVKTALDPLQLLPTR